LNQQDLLNILLSPRGVDLEGPLSLLVILIISLILGLCFRVVYLSYYKANEPIDGSIPRSFPVMAPAIAMVFWLIQYSLPLSLGLLGALSFVRFRTPVKRAEDIAFILCLIAGSLACAVKQFLAALMLIILIAGYGYLRNRFSFFSGENKQAAVITFNTAVQTNVENLLAQLKQIHSPINLLSTSIHDNITSIVLDVRKISGAVQNDIMSLLQEIDASARIDVFFPDRQMGGY
jgi:hypothetical protein